MDQINFIILAVMGTAIVLLILWALLGPRRSTDESGHHVELAEQTRKRDLERRMGRDPDGSEREK